MATGTVGKITTFGDPPNIGLGQVATPELFANVLATVNALFGSLLGGTLSAKSLAIDGVGNQASPALPGQLIVHQSTPADAAVGVFGDSAGNARAVFDHNGYPAGRRSEYRENWSWTLNVSTALSFQPVFSTGMCPWNGFTTNGTRNQITSQGGPLAGGGSMSTVFSSAVASDRSIIYAQQPWVNPQTFSSIVMEFEAQIGASPTGATIFFGLTDMNNGAGNAPSNSTPWVGLAARRDSSANWQLLHGDGTTLVYTDTGIAIDPTKFTWIRVRLELHGTGSPYGACARLFFNDVQAGSNVTTNIPTFANLAGVGLTPQFGQVATAGSNSVAFIGPVYLTYNRVALNSPSV